MLEKPFKDIVNFIILLILWEYIIYNVCVCIIKYLYIAKYIVFFFIIITIQIIQNNCLNK